MMCYGVPVVTTDRVGASFDIVRHGENGFVYHSGDVDKLTKLLSQLVSDEFLRRKMGERSLEIIANWNYDICVEGIVGALNYVTRYPKQEL